ncbi:hypothetical protein [Leucobacter sp.]
MSGRSERKRAALGRVVVEPAEPVAQTEEQGSRRPGRARRWVTAVVLALLLLVVAAVAYAVTLGPEQYAKLQAETADGASPVEIGAAATVVPERDWVVQPLVRDLFEWPPLPPLKDWSVLLDEQTGVLLLSPDQGLRVELDVLQGSSDRAALAWLREESRVISSDGAVDGDQGEPVLRTETLASGLGVRHVDGPERIAAVVDTGAGLLTVRADAGSEPIDSYRPAISALLESLGAPPEG